MSAVLLACGVALAGHGARASERDHVTGVLEIKANTNTSFNTQTAYAEQLDGDPFQVTGYASARPLVTPPELTLFRGPVTCLDVRGRTAGAIMRLDDGSKPPGVAGQVLFATVIDGGPRENDRIGFTSPVPVLPFQGCAPIDALAVNSIDSGDIVVGDRDRSVGR